VSSRPLGAPLPAISFAAIDALCYTSSIMPCSREFRILALLSTMILLPACSTAQVRVTRGADGVNQAIARDRARPAAEMAAAEAARNYCAERDQEPVLVEELPPAAQRAGQAAQATPAGPTDAQTRIWFRCESPR
jgi:hypothetical protein